MRCCNGAVYQKGYYATSITDIAAQARISKGLLYNYYSGKEELLSEMVHARIKEVVGVMEGAAALELPGKQLEHVLVLEQRGHGGSARTGAYSFELMCDDLLRSANAMQLERFTLLGHSMGGTVSYLFAESYPSRLERLVVADTRTDTDYRRRLQRNSPE